MTRETAVTVIIVSGVLAVGLALHGEFTARGAAHVACIEQRGEWSARWGGRCKLGLAGD